jgi:putative transposase
MQYRRAKVEGGTYFFTVVTEKRQKILCLPKNVSLLRSAFHYVMQKHPFMGISSQRKTVSFQKR